jgi:hypothetical protein
MCWPLSPPLPFRIKWNEDTRKSVLAKREAAEAEEDGDADPVENKCVQRCVLWSTIE